MQRGSESARWNLARAALIALAAASAPGRSGAAPPPSAAPPPCAVGDGATTLGMVSLSTSSADAPGPPPTLALRWLHIPKCGQSFATTLYWFGCRRVVRCFPTSGQWMISRSQWAGGVKMCNVAAAPRSRAPRPASCRRRTPRAKSSTRRRDAARRVLLFSFFTRPPPSGRRDAVSALVRQPRGKNEYVACDSGAGTSPTAAVRRPTRSTAHGGSVSRRSAVAALLLPQPPHRR